MPSHPNTLRFTLPPATSPWSNPLMSMANAPERSDRLTPSAPYYDTVRLRALAHYAETGNATQAANAVGIPRQTMDDWVRADSAPQLIDDLRSTIRYNCGMELARKVQVALANIDDDPTDDVVLRSGTIIRKRVPWKDRVIGMSILMDKWMLISGAISQSSALVAGMDKLSQQVSALGAGLLDQGLPPKDSSPDPKATGGETLVW